MKLLMWLENSVFICERSISETTQGTLLKFVLYVSVKL